LSKQRATRRDEPWRHAAVAQWTACRGTASLSRERSRAADGRGGARGSAESPPSARAIAASQGTLLLKREAGGLAEAVLAHLAAQPTGIMRQARSFAGRPMDFLISLLPSR
jgi:hypothetical protein